MTPFDDRHAPDVPIRTPFPPDPARSDPARSDPGRSGPPGSPPPHLAVVGAGIAGLAAAWMLSTRYQVTLYEAEPRLGGHSNTIDVPLPDGGAIPVDTGFMVYNHVAYPNLVQLFDRLGVQSDQTDMSFAVSIDDGRLEYSGGGVYLGLFAQARNMLRPRFLRMVADILRFYRTAPALARQRDLEHVTLGDLLDRAGFGIGLREDHLLPMASAIWSSAPAAILDFPAASFIRFFENHGLFKLSDRPKWRTVRGGSRDYVTRLQAGLAARSVTVRAGAPVAAVVRDGAGVTVRTASGRVGRHDGVVIATHADQALAMLATPSAAERSVLGRFRYSRNHTLLHTDPALMPRRRRVWSSWNYLAETGRPGAGQRPPSVTYWMNSLQTLDPAPPVFVSLNPLRDPDPRRVVAEMTYAHPIYDPAAMAGQRLLHTIQGLDRIWYCGSYFGYGFHEDGLTSGLNAAAALGAPAPWWPRTGPDTGTDAAAEPIWTGVVRGAA